MSSRWPQEQQHQRSAYATYEEPWPREDEGAQPGQDSGWPEPDLAGHAEQWATAPPSRDRAVGAYQEEWDRSAGGFGDDADYEWFQYLGGGRPASAAPPAVPARPPSTSRRGRPEPKPSREEKARRGDARPERPRSRRGRGQPGPAEPGRGRPEPAGPVRDRPEFTEPSLDRSDTDPRLGAPQFADPGYGPPPHTDPGLSRAAVAAPGPGGSVLAGPESDQPVPDSADHGTNRSGNYPGPRGQVSRARTREARPGRASRRQPAGLAPGGEPAGRDVMVRPSPGRERSGRQARRRGRRATAGKPASAPAASTVAREAPVKPARPAPERQPARATSTRKRRRVGGRTLALVGASAVLAGAGAGAVIFLAKSGGGGAAHVLTTPPKLGAYTQDPRLAQQMEARTLQRQIIQQSGGEARNVIYSVYADDPGSAAGSGQQVFLFIGGNLSGTSAGGFISSFTGRLPGAAATNPGSLGGDAACVPSEDGHPAACAWADNDTFGVVTSATLSASALADEMRHMRPLVEHQVNDG